MTTARKELRTARGIYGLERLHHKDEYADHWVGRAQDGAPVLVHIAPYTTMASPTRRAEFARASNAAMAMAPHANLCTALDGGEDETHVLYMVEVLHAELRLSTLLARALSDGGFPWWAGASLVMDAAKAVEALLQATPRKFSRYAVVEPDDFEVNTRGQLKLADAFAFLRQTSTPKVSLYRAPETWFRDRVDERSHVYVLGIWLWEFCAGRHLFLGGGSDAVMARTKAGVIPELPSGDAGVPEALAKVLRKALCQSPLDRFERPGEFAAALKEVLGDESLKLTHFVQTTCADLTHVAGGLRSPQTESQDTAPTPMAVSLPILSADILPGSNLASAAERPASADALEAPTGEVEEARTQVLRSGDYEHAVKGAPVPAEPMPDSEVGPGGTMVLKLSPEAEAVVAAQRAAPARPDTLPPLSDLTDPLAGETTDDQPLRAPEPESQRTKFAPLEAQAAVPIPPRPGLPTSLAPPPPPRPSLAAPPHNPLRTATTAAAAAVQRAQKSGPSKDVILGGIAASLALGIGVLMVTGRGKDPDVVVDPSQQTAPKPSADTGSSPPPTAATGLPPTAAVTPVPASPTAPALPAPAPHRTAPREGPAREAAPAKEPAGDMGMITVITTPACKLAVVDGTSAGPCPVVKKKFPAGVHVVKLVGPDGTVKTVALTVEAGRTTVKRETF